MDDERAFSDPAAEPHEDQRMQTGTQVNEVEGDGGVARQSEVATALMQELGRTERLFVVLRFGEQLEIPEIASVMRCTEQYVVETLATIKFRMRELLQSELAEVGTLNPSS